MSFSEPDTDILVPAFDVRALARRAAFPAALAAAAAAALVVAGGPLDASPTRCGAPWTPTRAG